MRRSHGENINGILLLDKPLHLSSNAALQKVKRLFNAKKAGHTGSLDPLATGMLPICFGEATKFCQFLLDADKTYVVTAKLGARTTTGDSEGEVIAENDFSSVTIETLLPILKEFIGSLDQVPPMFSAIKFQGQPLYKLARRGIEVDRKARTIQIYALDLLDFTEGLVRIRVHCSKGTYIRTLVDDIGLKLGCGAHVAQLRRSSVLPYQETNMVKLEDLETSPATLRKHLLPLETSVQSLPSFTLSSSAAFYLRMGQSVLANSATTEGLIRLFHNNEFLGIGEILSEGRIVPRRLTSPRKANAALSSAIE